MNKADRDMGGYALCYYAEGYRSGNNLLITDECEKFRISCYYVFGGVMKNKFQKTLKYAWNIFVAILLIGAIVGDYTLAKDLNAEIDAKMHSFLQSMK